MDNQAPKKEHLMKSGIDILEITLQRNLKDIMMLKELRLLKLFSFKRLEA
jgi:hypothetical protein